MKPILVGFSSRGYRQLSARNQTGYEPLDRRSPLHLGLRIRPTKGYIRPQIGPRTIEIALNCESCHPDNPRSANHEPE
jgi:hypothetical protein